MDSGGHSVDFGHIFLHSPNAIAIQTVLFDSAGKSQDFQFDAVNPAFETLFGLTCTELEGMTAKPLLPSLARSCLERFETVATSGEPVTFEYSLDSETRWFEVTAYRHQPGGVTAIFVDITQRSLERNKAREESAKLRTFFEIGNAVIMVYEVRTGAILMANRLAEAFYGWKLDELRTKRWEDINILSALEMEQEMDRAKQELRNHFHFRHRLRSGQIRDVEVYAKLGEWEHEKAIFALIHDVTEVASFRERLNQAEKLSAIGQTTSYINHEMGNLLATLQAQFEMMQVELPEGPVREKHSHRIHKQFLRANRLIESIKGFTKAEGVVIEEHSMSHVLEDILELEHPLLTKAGMELELRTCTEDMVQMEVALVQQVFLNLIKNSIEALRGVEQPRIWIEVKKDLKWVVVRYGNNGSEIPQDVRERLFQPYFYDQG